MAAGSVPGFPTHQSSSPGDGRALLEPLALGWGPRLGQGCAFRSDRAWLMKSGLRIFGYIFCKDASNSNVLLNTQRLINPSRVGWKLWTDRSLFPWPCWDQTLLVYVLTWTENNRFLYQVDESARERPGQQQHLCLVLPVLPIAARPAPVSYWTSSYLGEGLPSQAPLRAARGTVVSWSVAAFLDTVIMQRRTIQCIFHWLLCIKLTYRWYSH